MTATATNQTDTNGGYRRLACAILVEALRDAKNGDSEAMDWLRGPDAALYADSVDLKDWPPSLDRLRAVTLRRAPFQCDD